MTTTTMRRPQYANPQQGKRDKAASTFKTELCNNLPHCRFGINCEFAHGKEELRTKGLALLEREGRIPSQEKYRQFPCRSFVMTGSCPYKYRCVFLHDPRVGDTTVTCVPITRKTKEDTTKDTFYWPDMDADAVGSITDEKELPSVNQCYLIPSSFRNKAAPMHDKAVFSIWNHFTLFLSDDVLDSKYSDRENNRFLENQKRLPIFLKLSNTESEANTAAPVFPKFSSASKSSLDEESKEAFYAAEEPSPRECWTEFWM